MKSERISHSFDFREYISHFIKCTIIYKIYLLKLKENNMTLLLYNNKVILFFNVDSELNL
jgi:hypothetical protein